MDKKIPFKEHDKSLNKSKILEGRFCLRPFELLEIHKDFQTFPCCPSWLPVVVGNSKKTSIMEVWNSPIMQQIRQSIHDGNFKYCDHLECSEIQADRLKPKEKLLQYQDVIQNKKVILEGPPREIALCYDETCNLACPSCRKNKIQYSQGKEFETRSAFTDQIISLVNQYAEEFPIMLRVTGSGDPIASPIFYKLLKSLDYKKHPLLSVVLQTNGVMLTEKVWASLSHIHPLIVSVSISIDAATEETYKKVRRFGHWSQLQENLKFLAELRAANKFRYLSLNFVAQKENYSEIPAFVQMALKLKGVDDVFFSFVNDWDTWDKVDYLKQCIWKSDHPEFNQFLEILKSTVLSHPIVHLGNLTEYRNLALGLKGDSAS